MSFRLIVACLWMAACSSEASDLRVWTPEDHAHPPETQIDPNRVPQQEVPDLTVGELLWMRNCAQRPNNTAGAMNRKYIGSKNMVEFPYGN